jgi:hypothetical protein
MTLRKKKTITVSRTPGSPATPINVYEVEGQDRIEAVAFGVPYAGRSVEEVENAIKRDMVVEHPAHYRAKNIEAIDVIEEFELGFRLGNVVKYVLRAGKKGSAKEDLEKARWYLEREISKTHD